MKNLIYVFTGTGNSLVAAKKIAETLGDAEIRLIRNLPKPVDGKYERIGFVFPCYAAGAPAFVIDYIRNMNISKQSADYFFAVVTAGDKGANSISMISKELQRKGIELDFGTDLKTVGNYIALYAMNPSPEQKLKSADEQAEKIAQQILKKTRLDRNDSAFHANPFVTLYYNFAQLVFAAKGRKMHAEPSCTGCGLCVKLCPSGNIRMAGGVPEFGRECTQCMACVQ